MQRILNVEYSLPANASVSPECQDLLSQLLVADPRSRISMDGIWQHPWFQQNLPEGVAEMNMHLLANPETFTGPGQQVCFLSCPSASQPAERATVWQSPASPRMGPQLRPVT